MLKILAVDNDAYTLKLIEKLFRDKAVEIHSASNGAEALRYFDEERFNLILMDQRLQTESGLEILKEMWRRSPRQLAILMTGYADESEAFREAKGRLFGCLNKPFRSLEELEGMVERALELDSAYREIKDLRHALKSRTKHRP